MHESELKKRGLLRCFHNHIKQNQQNNQLNEKDIKSYYQYELKEKEAVALPKVHGE